MRRASIPELAEDAFGAPTILLGHVDDHLPNLFGLARPARGRTVDEWKLRPERSDNHSYVWWAAPWLASIQGVSLFDGGTRPSTKRKRFKQSDLQRKKAPFQVLQSGVGDGRANVGAPLSGRTI